MRPAPVVLVAAAVCFLLGPTAAWAGRVEAPGDGNVYFRAAPGERNEVWVSTVAGDAGLVRFVDGGTAITAGRGCSSPPAARDTAVCPAPAHALASVVLRLGDRSDSLRGGGGINREGAYRVFAGRGDDRIRNQHGGAATVHGQRGDDTLFIHNNHSPGYISGGPGDDDLSGIFGEGSRRGLLDGGRGEDTIHVVDFTQAGDGGPGADELLLDLLGTATYEERTRPVSVTLDGLPNDGQRGEGDNVIVLAQPHGATHPSVLGGSGADRLIGSPDRDWLLGGPGDDFLDGREGSDHLDCGPAADIFVFDPLDATIVDCEAMPT